jgi:type IV secretory pathway TrbL component
MHVGAAMLVFLMVMTLVAVVLVPVAIGGRCGFFFRMVMRVIISVLDFGVIFMASFFRAVIVRMVIAAFTGMIAMVMTFKGTTFAERQFGQARYVLEFNHLGLLRQGFERLV